MTSGLPWATRPNRFRQVMPRGGESLCAGVALVGSLVGSANAAGRAPVHGAVAETDAHAPDALRFARPGQWLRAQRDEALLRPEVPMYLAIRRYDGSSPARSPSSCAGSQ